MKGSRHVAIRAVILVLPGRPEYNREELRLFGIPAKKIIHQPCYANGNTWFVKNAEFRNNSFLAVY